jgi:crotonobetaine/carnitine-CoA ligase
MCSFLVKQPVEPGEREHGLRNVSIVPFAEEAVRFGQRFGVDVWTMFNMTETALPLFSERNPRALGSCGRPRPGIAVRIVDGHDCEVPVGAVGELVVRSDLPWSMNHGYWRNAEATARAWRNGWFHTGDAFRRDAEGNHFFVDRIKDAIRRRGENISSFEVESEILAHPEVREAAVVAVPSEYGEDEVLAVVAPQPGASIDPVALTRFLAGRLPHFMVPRYLRLLPELPKTPTQKVQKHMLRAEGLASGVWDREAAGMRLGRPRLGPGRDG